LPVRRQRRFSVDTHAQDAIDSISPTPRYQVKSDGLSSASNIQAYFSESNGAPHSAKFMDANSALFVAQILPGIVVSLLLLVTIWLEPCVTGPKKLYRLRRGVLALQVFALWEVTHTERHSPGQAGASLAVAD